MNFEAASFSCFRDIKTKSFHMAAEAKADIDDTITANAIAFRLIIAIIICLQPVINDGQVQSSHKPEVVTDKMAAVERNRKHTSPMEQEDATARKSMSRRIRQLEDRREGAGGISPALPR